MAEDKSKMVDLDTSGDEVEIVLDLSLIHI